MLWSFQSKASLSADTSLAIINRNFANLPTAGPTYQCGNIQVTFSSVTELPDGTFTATIAASGTVGTVVQQNAFWYGPVPPAAGGGVIRALDPALNPFTLQGPAPSVTPLL